MNKLDLIRQSCEKYKSEFVEIWTNSYVVIGSDLEALDGAINIKNAVIQPLNEYFKAHLMPDKRDNHLIKTDMLTIFEDQITTFHILNKNPYLSFE